MLVKRLRIWLLGLFSLTLIPSTFAAIDFTQPFALIFSLFNDFFTAAEPYIGQDGFQRFMYWLLIFMAAYSGGQAGALKEKMNKRLVTVLAVIVATAGAFAASPDVMRAFGDLVAIVIPFGLLFIILFSLVYNKDFMSERPRVKHFVRALVYLFGMMAAGYVSERMSGVFSNSYLGNAAFQLISLFFAIIFVYELVMIFADGAKAAIQNAQSTPQIANNVRNAGSSLRQAWNNLFGRNNPPQGQNTSQTNPTASNSPTSQPSTSQNPNSPGSTSATSPDLMPESTIIPPPVAKIESQQPEEEKENAINISLDSLMKKTQILDSQLDLTEKSLLNFKDKCLQLSKDISEKEITPIILSKINNDYINLTKLIPDVEKHVALESSRYLNTIYEQLGKSVESLSSIYSQLNTIREESEKVKDAEEIKDIESLRSIINRMIVILTTEKKEIDASKETLKDMGLQIKRLIANPNDIEAHNKAMIDAKSLSDNSSKILGSTLKSSPVARADLARQSQKIKSDISGSSTLKNAVKGLKSHLIEFYNNSLSASKYQINSITRKIANTSNVAGKNKRLAVIKKISEIDFIQSSRVNKKVIEESSKVLVDCLKEYLKTFDANDKKMAIKEIDALSGILLSFNKDFSTNMKNLK